MESAVTLKDVCLTAWQFCGGYRGLYSPPGPSPRVPVSAQSVVPVIRYHYRSIGYAR